MFNRWEPRAVLASQGSGVDTRRLTAAGIRVGCQYGAHLAGLPRGVWEDHGSEPNPLCTTDLKGKASADKSDLPVKDLLTLLLDTSHVTGWIHRVVMLGLSTHDRDEGFGRPPVHSSIVQTRCEHL